MRRVQGRDELRLVVTEPATETTERAYERPLHRHGYPSHEELSLVGASRAHAQRVGATFPVEVPTAILRKAALDEFPVLERGVQFCSHLGVVAACRFNRVRLSGRSNDPLSSREDDVTSAGARPHASAQHGDAFLLLRMDVHRDGWSTRSHQQVESEHIAADLTPDHPHPENRGLDRLSGTHAATLYPALAHGARRRSGRNTGAGRSCHCEWCFMPKAEAVELTVSLASAYPQPPRG